MIQQYMDANEMETSEFSLCSGVVKYVNICSSILTEELVMIWWNKQWLPETTGHSSN